MILVLNCGSQSIKWKVFDANLKAVKEATVVVFAGDDYKKILRDELNKARGFKIQVVGHRVVHGKDIFKKPAKITADNLPELEKLSGLAPLHNPFNVLGIKTCQKMLAGVPNIAVFDTEFFNPPSGGLPERAFTYALPQEIVREFGFRRYGFHGISHEYVARRACEILEEQAKKVHPVKYRKAVISTKPKLFERARIITCHLGGGASITAIKNGEAIDTSMGFTPLEGLVMMTRTGNIDAGIVLELVKKYGVEKTSEILNKESGIKGICREGDMLRVLEKIKSGDKSAKLALDVFVYSIQKYIGAYFAVLGGCDVLVFTGSIGSGSAKIRNMICRNLEILKNTKVLSIKTDEESAIAEKVSSVKY